MPSTISNSSETFSKDSIEHREHVRIRKPFNNLVKLFKDQSNKNDVAIHEYIEV